jgi:large subunit ribosomal protein L18
MTVKMDRTRKKKRIRKCIRGDRARPRLAVFRSSKHIYAQVIDDDAGRTIAAASSVSKKVAGGGAERSKSDMAFEIGKVVAAACKAKGIKTVVFDRGGYEYHGRVAKVAEGAREGGLDF